MSPKRNQDWEEEGRLVNDIFFFFKNCYTMSTGQLSALLLKISPQLIFLLPMPRRNLLYHPSQELMHSGFQSVSILLERKGRFPFALRP